jgi:hypothetical protein
MLVEPFKIILSEQALVVTFDRPCQVVSWAPLHSGFRADVSHVLIRRVALAEDRGADLKAEFDALYAEAGTRRRMMSVSAHDRIAGRPSRAKVLEQVHHLRAIPSWRRIHAER